MFVENSLFTLLIMIVRLKFKWNVRKFHTLLPHCFNFLLFFLRFVLKSFTFHAFSDFVYCLESLVNLQTSDFIIVTFFFLNLYKILLI